MAVTNTLKKNTKLGAQGTEMLHNGEKRKELIVTTIKKVADLKKKRDAINAQIREELQANVKGILGMKLVDFSIACRMYDLESADRDEMFTTLQETFNALGLGAQLDFIEALKSGQQKPETVADEGRTKHAGYEAGRQGLDATTNPHKKGSIQANIWHENWLRGLSDNVEELSGDKKKTGGGDAAPKTITRKAAGPKK